MVDKINRTALITGGSGGIGSNICENLASKNINYSAYVGRCTFSKNRKSVKQGGKV